jgi:hypothetical protein
MKPYGSSRDKNDDDDTYNQSSHRSLKGKGGEYRGTIKNKASKAASRRNVKTRAREDAKDECENWIEDYTVHGNA